jgi:hypothetical protein
MLLKTDTSLLSKDESNAIKGLMIIFIIAGHNIFLTDAGEWIDIMGFLYCFHLSIFFLLPFMYDFKGFTIHRLRDQFIRSFVPFISLMFLFFLVYCVLTHSPMSRVYKLPLAWLIGGPDYIQQLVGSRYLWFLPRFFWMIAIKELWTRMPNGWRTVFLFLSILVALIIGLMPWLPKSLRVHYGAIDKYGIYFLGGISSLAWGMLARWCIERRLLGKGAAITILILCVIAFFVNIVVCVRPKYTYNIMTSVHCGLRLIMPLSVLLLLVHCRESLSRNWLFVLFGQHSFVVFLLHPLVGYALFLWLKRYDISSLWLFLPVQLLMMFVPLAISVKLDSFPRLRRILVPKGYEDWLEGIKGSQVK